MQAAVLVARLLLASVFFTAAAGKALDLSGTRDAIADFGVRRGLARPVALVLPIVELAIAVPLLPASSAVVAAIAALVVLAIFSVAIALNLARGRRPDCHCFGGLSSEPIGAATLIRNGALGALAAFVAVAGPGWSVGDLGDWLGGGSSRESAALALALALAVAVGLLAWLQLQLLRQNGRLLTRIDELEARLGGRTALPHGLPVGAQAPEFALPDASGATRTLAGLLEETGGRPLTLVFSDPECGACAPLLEAVTEQSGRNGSAQPFVVVTRLPGNGGPASAAERRFQNILFQQGHEVMTAYDVPGTPAGVLVLPDGTVGSPAALGADAVRAMFFPPADVS